MRMSPAIKETAYQPTNPGLKIAPNIPEHRLRIEAEARTVMVE